MEAFGQDNGFKSLMGLKSIIPNNNLNVRDYRRSQQPKNVQSLLEDGSLQPTIMKATSRLHGSLW